MAVVRVNKTQNYTVMSNYHFREKEMSLKAKGLLSLMLSLPDGWDYSISGLVSICKENETAIKSALKELRTFGYLKISKLMPDKDKHRTRIEYIYDIFEQPQEGKKQEVENLPLEHQPLENPIQLNTKVLNTKVLNTNISIDEIEENFEKLWGSLKANPNDRKSKVSKARKKELFKMGDKAFKAIELYLKVQPKEYYHKRDNILNNIIDNYIGKSEKDFTMGSSDHVPSYDIEEYEKMTEVKTENKNKLENKSHYQEEDKTEELKYEYDMDQEDDNYLLRKLEEMRKPQPKPTDFDYYIF